MGSFDRYLDEQLQDPEFRQAFDRYSAEIAAIDEFIRSLDRRREVCGISKADLARSMGKEPATVRKLFSDEGANPTLRTVLACAEALGLEVRLAPRRRAGKTAAPRRKAAATS
jgi:transcriptional regulator with XRE-family HTH domain